MSFDISPKEMVKLFQAKELQEVLRWAGRTQTGRRAILLARVERLLDEDSVHFNVIDKIREVASKRNNGNNRRRRGFRSRSGRVSRPPRRYSPGPVSRYLNMSDVPETASREAENEIISSSAETHERPTPTPQIPNNERGNRVVLKIKQGAEELTSSTIIMSYPVADVQFKKLPFYVVQKELVPPTTIFHINSRPLYFFLTPQQSEAIKDSLYNKRKKTCMQVQIRVGFMESTSEQEDHFPPGLRVFVNNKEVVPWIETPPVSKNVESGEWKRHCHPIDITDKIILNPATVNAIEVTSHPYYRQFVAAIYLVQKLESETLIKNLKKNEHRNTYFTKGMITQKLSGDLDIRPTYLRVSLVCPLSCIRMVLPCRANSCDHVQCFDALAYIKLNEIRSTWTCPVCNNPATYSELQIDDYFMEVLLSQRLPSTCKEIEVLADGSWTPLMPKEDKTKDVLNISATVSTTTIDLKNEEINVVELSSSDETNDEDICVVSSVAGCSKAVAPILFCSLTEGGKKFNSSATQPICEIDLVSSEPESSGSEIILPIRKRRRLSCLSDDGDDSCQERNINLISSGYSSSASEVD